MAFDHINDKGTKRLFVANGDYLEEEFEVFYKRLTFNFKTTNIEYLHFTKEAISQDEISMSVETNVHIHFNDCEECFFGSSINFKYSIHFVKTSNRLRNFLDLTNYKYHTYNNEYWNSETIEFEKPYLERLNQNF